MDLLLAFHDSASSWRTEWQTMRTYTFMLAQASAQMPALHPDAIHSSVLNQSPGLTPTPDIPQSILLPNVTEGDETSGPNFGHVYNGMQSSLHVTFSQDASRALPVADQQRQRFGLLTTYNVYTRTCTCLNASEKFLLNE